MRSRTWAAAVLALVVWAAPASAETKLSIEGFGGMGTGAKTGDLDFDRKFSGGGGIGYEVARNLQLRADAAAFNWNGAFTRTLPVTGICFRAGSQLVCFTGGGGTSEVRQELKNTPVFVGGRYFMGSSKSFRPYVEAGAGINPLTLRVTSSGRSASSSEESGTKVGAIPGAGIEYRIGKTLGLGVGGRYYYIPKGVGEATDVESSFFTTSAALVLHF